MSENKTQWENVYNDKGDFQKMEYPSDIIVTFVRRSRFNKIAPKDRNQIRCCDLGCGWGNNLEFLKKESFDCYGVDFCQKVIDRLKKRYRDKVLCCDFKSLPFPDSYFDFCIDRSSIQHNTKEDIALIHKEVYRLLKPGGIFFSSIIKSGNVKSGDTEFLTGYLSEEELKQSFSKFSHFDLDYLRITRNNRKEDFTHYLVTATK